MSENEGLHTQPRAYFSYLFAVLMVGVVLGILVLTVQVVLDGI